MRRKPTRLAGVVSIARVSMIITLTAAALSVRYTSASPPIAAGWMGSWTASPQPLHDPSLSFSDTTLRQIVHLSAGGVAVRIRLDNTFGNQPVTFTEIQVAPQDIDGATRAGTSRTVRFGGHPSVTVAQGAQALSDLVELSVPAEANLAVSMYLPGSAEATGHHNAGQSSFIASGNHVADVSGAAFANSISDWYWLAGVEVLNPFVRGAVVTLGDSITNGAWSSWNQNGRWPDYLARRLLALPPGHVRSVLNQGIDGNKLLLYRDCCGNSTPGLARLDRDAIVQTGVTHVLVLLGTNDIADGGSADAFIAGYRQLAAQLHARGLAIIGGTIPPWGGFDSNPQHEVERQKVNQWMRTTRILDGLVDFDVVLRDPSDPTRLLPAYDSSDHLHPGPAGYEAMGNSIDLRLFH